jgi:3-methyladenine DNA glycosylase/8-oxoguanine DNA glycosylase
MSVAIVPPDPAATPDRDSGPPPDTGLRREWLAPYHVDVRLTLSVHRRGGRDPAYRVDAAGAVWRTSLTPDGPGTLRVTSRPADDPAAPPGAPALPGTPAPPGAPGQAAAAGGTVVTGQAWGPGARWLLDNLPAQLGEHDDLTGFTARHPVLSELVLRYPGLRVGRTWRVFEALVPAVLEQKVVGQEAHRAWRILLGTFGESAPGPAPDGMRVCPPPRVWARVPSWDWHRAGVEGVRARTIIAAAGVAGRLEQVLELSPAEADRRLRSIPGIGLWTSAEIRQRAAGDADAVSAGDYHLPKAVGWTLAGRITDDAGMLELLAPYAGHRYRVTRLIELGGSQPPRRGPHLPVRDYRSF